MPTRDDVSKKIIVLEYNSDIFYIHWVPFMVLVYSCDNFDSPFCTHEAHYYLFAKCPKSMAKENSYLIHSSKSSKYDFLM